jgi:Mg2+-importing ATPase
MRVDWASSGSDDAFWGLEADELVARLRSSLTGLRHDEAELRLRAVGPNRVVERYRRSALRLLLRQFESPLVLILIFGAIVSLTLHEWVDASVILVIVLGSALLGFVQEFRASIAVAKLRTRLALRATVWRDQRQQMIPVADLVPGDVIALNAGDLIPADCLVLEANDFLVTEASLTGESFPVEKRPGVVSAGAPLADRTNAIFMGASVRSGTARAIVVKTGPRAAFGAVAARLQARVG